MRTIIHTTLLTAALGLSSCSSFRYTHLSGPETARVPAASVNTYTRYSQIEPQLKDITPVGKIVYKCKKEEKVWEKAREIAGKHGANSVYMDKNIDNDDNFKTRGVIYTFNKKPE